MNIHEYQAKQLFQRFNVATPKGGPAETPEEAEKVAAGLNTENLVVKAQIHAGGRGKGTFSNGFKGGVKLCTTPAEARELAKKMLGQTLVTHQTGPTGKVVRKVLIAESVDIAREVYFAILMDRASGAPVVVASTEGGVEIETVAEEHPEKIMHELVHPLLGLRPFQALKLGRTLNFRGKQLKDAAKMFSYLFAG
jgi:succinyl-CoA synthetase beta subunit